MRRLATILLSLLLTATFQASARAQTSAIGFQATLTGVSDGPHTMTFSLYDVATGGTPLQTVGPQIVTVQGGVVSTSIAFDPVHWTGQPRWIEVSPDAMPALLPRIGVSASPLAANAMALGSSASVVHVPGETQLRVVPRDAQSPAEIGVGSPDLGSTQLLISTSSVVDGYSFIQPVKRNGSEWGVLKLCPDGGYVETFSEVVSRYSAPLEFAFRDYGADETVANWNNTGVSAAFFRIAGATYETAAGFGVAVGDQIASPVVWLYSPFGRSSFQVRQVTQYLGSAVQPNTSQLLMDVNGGGATFYRGVSVPVLTIRGGSDLAEPFDVAPADAAGDAAVEPAPGMVMSIDREADGRLRPATREYDTAVAGVISGANGLSPGMVMGKEGDSLAHGEHPLAMAGRVWVLADAAFGAIRRGDRLTTSSTPGHAMRVGDDGRAPGAVIGKAMTELEEGRGHVLVLVNLQ